MDTDWNFIWERGFQGPEGAASRNRDLALPQEEDMREANIVKRMAAGRA